MIDMAEMSTRARKLRLEREHIEKDHLMCCVLASVADRLAHQLGELPSFEDAYAAVRQRLADWQTTSTSP